MSTVGWKTPMVDDPKKIIGIIIIIALISGTSHIRFFPTNLLNANLKIHGYSYKKNGGQLWVYPQFQVSSRKLELSEIFGCRNYWSISVL